MKKEIPVTNVYGQPCSDYQYISKFTKESWKITQTLMILQMMANTKIVSYTNDVFIAWWMYS